MTEPGDPHGPGSVEPVAPSWPAPVGAPAPPVASAPDISRFAAPDPATAYVLPTSVAPASLPPQAPSSPAPVWSVPAVPAPAYGAPRVPGYAPVSYGSGAYPAGYAPGYSTSAYPPVSAVAGRSGARVPVVFAVLAVLVAVVLVAAVVLPRVLPGADGRRAVAGGTAASGGSGGREVTDPAAREAAIAAVLATRGTAVTKDDARAWTGTQQPGGTTPAFARLAALPITVWRYDIASVDTAGTESDVNLIVRVHTRYDVDTADAFVNERMTLRHSALGWRVVTEVNDSRRVQPWDLGTLTVVHGTRSLVIGIDQRPAVLRRYADIADSVTPDVTAVWGSDWNQHPVLIVPKTVGQLGRALDQTESFLGDFAAVTTGESGNAAPSRTAYRVWTNTPGLSDVGTLGREIVLRHEITHVATGAPETPSVPLWLEEGFAEYVGYSTTSVPERTAWAELVTAVRAGKAPTTLPDDDAFHAGSIDLAYESADLACRLVAERYGRAGLVRLYRLVRGGTGSADANLDAALVKVTGSGTTAFVAAWRARMARLG